MKKFYTFKNRIKKRWNHLKKEYKYNRKILFHNLLKLKLPKYDVLAFFSIDEGVNVDIETIYKHHSTSEITFINKLAKSVAHEILHSEIGRTKKHLSVEQDHWAIRNMGF